MTKADLVQAILEQRPDLTLRDAAELVESTLEAMKVCLISGEQLKVSGFGNFDLKDKKERLGRNPQTGVPMVIAARRVVTFKPSTLLRQRMNEQ